MRRHRAVEIDRHPSRRGSNIVRARVARARGAAHERASAGVLGHRRPRARACERARASNEEMANNERVCAHAYKNAPKQAPASVRYDGSDGGDGGGDRSCLFARSLLSWTFVVRVVCGECRRRRHDRRHTETHTNEQAPECRSE